VLLSLEAAHELGSCVPVRLLNSLSPEDFRQLPPRALIVCKQSATIEAKLQSILEIRDCRLLHMRFQRRDDLVHGSGLLRFDSLRDAVVSTFVQDDFPLS